MISRSEVLNLLKEKYDDLSYDEETGLINCSGVSLEFEKVYKDILKRNGMSFNCICDVYWEDMSVMECTECGTVIKCYYDESYEPNFRCPVCTDYETGYEYHTKEEIDSSEELQAIIKMYKDLSNVQKENNERTKERNGLNDWELCKPFKITIGDVTYEFQLLIDSITNKNKLQGLKLEVLKWKRSGEYARILQESKTIPLSKRAYDYYKHYILKLKTNPEFNPFDELKGKSLSQAMEEEVVRKLKKDK